MRRENIKKVRYQPKPKKITKRKAARRSARSALKAERTAARTAKWEADKAAQKKADNDALCRDMGRGIARQAAQDRLTSLQWAYRNSPATYAYLTRS